MRFSLSNCDHRGFMMVTVRLFRMVTVSDVTSRSGCNPAAAIASMRRIVSDLTVIAFSSGDVVGALYEVEQLVRHVLPIIPREDLLVVGQLDDGAVQHALTFGRQHQLCVTCHACPPRFP